MFSSSEQPSKLARPTTLGATVITAMLAMIAVYLEFLQ